jgi:hypothetical protein
MEAWVEAVEAATTLRQRYADNPVARELATHLPELTERLKRCSEAVAEIAETGVTLTEKVVAFARKRAHRFENAANYIRRLGGGGGRK